MKLISEDHKGDSPGVHGTSGSPFPLKDVGFVGEVEVLLEGTPFHFRLCLIRRGQIGVIGNRVLGLLSGVRGPGESVESMRA